MEDEERRVTWRLEIYAGWGMRLDPHWLPTSGTEAWKKVFEGEDLAGRAFAAGGVGMAWGALAEVAATLTTVLEQYRMQVQVAEEIGLTCPDRAEAHLAALAVPRALRPPKRTHPAGAWRLCSLQEGRARTIAEYPDVDLAEGAAVAHRAAAADRAFWTEPLASGRGPEPGGEPGWLPRVDTDLRLRAFAAEDAVDALARAAAGRYVGPDTIGVPLLCVVGQAAHHMIREYRTLLRAVWTDMEACPHAQAHDDDADARVGAAPQDPEKGPGGKWRHMELGDDRMWALNRHPSRAAALAAVAAERATDDEGVRWAEPVLRPR